MHTRHLPVLSLLFVVTVLLAGCELVGDLLELGIWMIVIAVVFVVAIIGWGVNKLRGPRRP